MRGTYGDFKAGPVTTEEDIVENRREKAQRRKK